MNNESTEKTTTKSFMKRLSKGLLPLSAAAVAVAVLGIASPCRADNIQTLTDLNSSVTVDLSAQSGMNNWTVDGVSPLTQQWFWYRIGSSGPQASLDTLALSGVSNLGNTLQATYTGSGFNIDMTYQLTGGAAGSGSSDIQESIQINNTSTNALAFHFFQFSHFNFSGGNDTVNLHQIPSGPSAGLIDEALQTGAGMSLNESVDTVNTPGANHGEAGLASTILSELNGGAPYTLNGNLSSGPGNVGWALEWDESIAAGSSFTIDKDKGLQVPEPAATALLALGLAVYAARRRSAA